MRNVTITLDDETARWARVEAAKRDLSLSGLIRELLQERMEVGESYEEAMEAYFAVEPAPLSGGGKYPTRDEIHDRASLR